METMNLHTIFVDGEGRKFRAIDRIMSTTYGSYLAKVEFGLDDPMSGTRPMIECELRWDSRGGGGGVTDFNKLGNVQR